MRTFCLLTILFCCLTLNAQAEKTEPISLEKARMIGLVEDFFTKNYRDVTMRKTLEWGNVETDENGSSTIRYKYVALIWDKERMTLCEEFTFDKDGNFIKNKKVDGYPQNKIEIVITEKSKSDLYKLSKELLETKKKLRELNLAKLKLEQQEIIRVFVESSVHITQEGVFNIFMKHPELLSMNVQILELKNEIERIEDEIMLRQEK